jgi:citronellol/citronellal dehydrogenase
MHYLRDKVIFITGASRGIGREIALRCAAEGAKIVVTGKTVAPHPKLEGTIHSVVDEIRQAGGEALAIQLDVREAEAVKLAVEQAAAHFGGIDILVNNAGAIGLTTTTQTSVKRFDLMWEVNTRATFLASQACIPYLKRSDNPHILTLAPPLNLQAKWFAPHLAYSISKYGMSLAMLGLAEELLEEGIACNCLWPRTTIATAAIENNFSQSMMNASRWPSIVADAAKIILTRDSNLFTGHFYVDEDVLREAGVSNFDAYAVLPGTALCSDLFLG